MYASSRQYTTVVIYMCVTLERRSTNTCYSNILLNSVLNGEFYTLAPNSLTKAFLKPHVDLIGEFSPRQSQATNKLLFKNQTYGGRKGNERTE